MSSPINRLNRLNQMTQQDALSNDEDREFVIARIYAAIEQAEKAHRRATEAGDSELAGQLKHAAVSLTVALGMTVTKRRAQSGAS